MCICSVVITGKNCQETILETLASINSQCTQSKIEVVYFDDNSSDKSLELVKGFVFNDNIKLVTSFGDIGRARALNKAVSISSGQYICILDADDLFLPGKLSSQLEIMEDKPEIAVLATKFVVGDIYSDHLLPKTESKSNSGSELNTLSLKDFIRGNPICHSSVMMRRNVVVYDNSLSRHIDLKLWLELSSTHYGKIAILEKAYTFKRLHEGQSFEAKKRLSYIFSSLRMSLSYAKPLYLFIPDILIRSARLAFQMLPRFITVNVKKILNGSV